MITRLKLSDNQQVTDILYFLKYSYSPDFFYTKDNQRIYIETENQLKQLIKECQDVWISQDDTEINGIVVLWTAKNGESKRNYVKLAAKTRNAADKLVTVLLWNHSNETFIKINKKSPFLSLFYQKGFKFLSGRGKQLLLKRNKYIERTKYEKRV